MRSSARVAPARWPASVVDTLATPSARPVRPADTLAIPSARPVSTTAAPPTGARPATALPAAADRPEPEEERGSRGWELTLFRHLNYPGARR
ncbi:hypothetical protein ACEXQE_14715 [Herbiconiux sp. P17]|uniref:hypothetical protein n=1 Tax=Herbiconiux wuyangfengii TaxID=3342794 RepID=UPI0035B90FFC